ncbi:MAG: UDP-2,3-diacylglucosamine hydrolase [Bacteroidia bacterium]|nr:MAG: UDP-2,3-diacylglucosamine hydrolase [Bacteroidia bacterium]
MRATGGRGMSSPERGGRRVLFASDFHLGLPAGSSPRERERLIVDWLRHEGAGADAVYLLGDIFDFWYEYRYVVPKGFTRFFGAVAALVDAGVEVHFFTGNHDVWMFSYLGEELGVRVHRSGERLRLNGVDLYLCHGDGLGPSGRGYKLLRRIFHCRVLQRMFSWIHPGFSMWLGQSWSRASRKSKALEHPFRGDDEPVCHFARALRATAGVDYFIMGHLHVPVLHRMEGGGAVLVLGNWIGDSTYAMLEGQRLSLRRYEMGGRSAELDSLELTPGSEEGGDAA